MEDSKLVLQGIYSSSLQVVGETLVFKDGSKERALPIAQIERIDFKPAGDFTKGHISYMNGGIFSTSMVIYFKAPQNDAAKRIVDYCRQYKQMKPTNHDDQDPLEKISKLKELLDSGAITEEEFRTLKAKLIDSL